ncbi:argininosuccinate lyase [Candidatus Micrarchaeota archaeon CG08_land_8_20_14_0_20_49_17]|nr:MAG: argininosuccinate lyase [Candidatus Micrarchaeota archaeon CG1_02_49_24]PIU09721.1 MAG: argininosuccinate lyase [Candidatus Micrarchaeota archaeon CG08_land_8_20_14_0_20_49_17]HII53302.1 argininosuccinate lyase [Candidatus Micrarchaeota archaeon]
MVKLRARFTRELDKSVASFMSAENLEADAYLVPYDILVNKAHTLMLAKQKIISAAEAMAILSALKNLESAQGKGKFLLEERYEDVHMNVEAFVTQETAAGKKMHTARSRNDQVNADMRLYMRERIIKIIGCICKTCEAIIISDKDNKIFPAYTHTRIAQPITFGYWKEALVVSLLRDVERLQQLYERVNLSPLGACACTGTSWDIDRDYTARLLGFAKPVENEFDAINSRGEPEAELLFIESLVAVKISRIAEEVIFLSEKGIMELDDSVCTTSSIMPQKKNPDVFELLRGSPAAGELVNALMIMKGLMSSHNADTQNIKIITIKKTEAFLQMLGVAAVAFSKIKVNEKVAGEELEKGFANATELADMLAQSGMAFREAHGKVGALVKHAASKGKHLGMLTKEELEAALGTRIESSTQSVELSTNRSIQTAQWCRMQQMLHSMKLENEEMKPLKKFNKVRHMRQTDKSMLEPAKKWADEKNAHLNQAAKLIDSEAKKLN